MKWFFASWDEDVNVPVDEEAGQISGMAETLREQVDKLGQCAKNETKNTSTSASAVHKQPLFL